jgi:hypothetical protein
MYFTSASALIKLSTATTKASYCATDNWPYSIDTIVVLFINMIQMQNKTSTSKQT